MATSVILYIGKSENRLDPTTRVIDATNELGPNGGTYNFTNLAPGKHFHVWVKIMGPLVIERILKLGLIRTKADTIILPVIVSATAALSSTRPASSIVAAWNVTDNYAVESVYVLLSDTQSQNPGAALIKSAGVRLTTPATSTTLSDLRPSTRYYGWILARDDSGNETAVTSLTPAYLVAAADTTTPTIGQFSLTRSSVSPETELVLQVTINDVV